MKIRLLMAFAVMAMFLTFAPVVSAGTQGACSNPGSAGVSVRLWENVIGDGSDGNDSVWLMCNSGTSRPDLDDVNHTLADGCKSQSLFKLQDDWNDCVNSVTVYLVSSSWRVCFYQNANYGGYISGSARSGPLQASRYNLSSSDTLSSVRISYLTSC